jgi:hypothetical protein
MDDAPTHATAQATATASAQASANTTTIVMPVWIHNSTPYPAWLPTHAELRVHIEERPIESLVYKANKKRPSS